MKLESEAPLAPSYMWGELAFRLYARGKGSAYATTAGPETHAVLPIYGALRSVDITTEKHERSPADCMRRADSAVRPCAWLAARAHYRGR